MAVPAILNLPGQLRRAVNTARTSQRRSLLGAVAVADITIALRPRRRKRRAMPAATGTVSTMVIITAPT
jgi:hypothetical protein